MRGPGPIHRIRRLIDRDLTSNSRPVTPLLGFMLVALAGAAYRRLPTAAGVGVLAAAVVVAIAWTAFAWWRAYRLFLATRIDRGGARR